MIQYKNVTKTFGAQTVLKNLNLCVEPGKITAIMGPSGAGKSVTLKLLMGLLKPDQGHILVDGQDVTQMSENELKDMRKKFGMLFQDAALFDYMTVLENVGFPLLEHTHLTDAEIEVKVNAMLDEVGLKNINHKLPSELSGGMRKRVGLARALMLEPKIILFDEPTTGLDPITTAQIGDLLLETQSTRNATVLLISHDLPLTHRVADRVAMLYNGEIVELCTPSQLQSSRHPFVQSFLEAQSTLGSRA